MFCTDCILVVVVLALSVGFASLISCYAVFFGYGYLFAFGFCCVCVVLC